MWTTATITRAAKSQTMVTTTGGVRLEGISQGVSHGGGYKQQVQWGSTLLISSHKLN